MIFLLQIIIHRSILQFQTKLYDKAVAYNKRYTIYQIYLPSR